MIEQDKTPLSEVADVEEAAPVVVEPAAPPSTPAERNTAEHWATRAGYLPRETRPGVLNRKWGAFFAAKHRRGWPEGAEMTEAEFSAAIVEATTGTSHG